MPRTKTNLLVLRTPEGITFSMPLASPVSRLLAWAVDAACILAASGLVRQTLSLAGSVDQGLVRASLVIGYFAISVGYGIACEWYWRGQTVGKLRQLGGSAPESSPGSAAAPRVAAAKHRREASRILSWVIAHMPSTDCNRSMKWWR